MFVLATSSAETINLGAFPNVTCKVSTGEVCHRWRTLEGGRKPHEQPQGLCYLVSHSGTFLQRHSHSGHGGHGSQPGAFVREGAL